MIPIYMPKRRRPHLISEFWRTIIGVAALTAIVVSAWIWAVVLCAR
jgi:hypothetical protein